MEELCQGIEDVPSNARLMKIMANQATNMVSIIKLLDATCWYTEPGKETLQELCKVCFPNSKVTDDPVDGQGQPYLDMQK
jgi:hypothetical protein